MMMLGIMMFSLNDAMGKWLVATYSVGQILMIRSGAGLVMLLPLAARQGFASLVWPERPLLQAARAAAATIEVAIFYWVLAYLPLADTMTFILASPILVVLLSALFLGERVSAQRWLLVAIGFAGVVIALRPSSQAIALPAIGALFGALMFALMNITGRQLRTTPDVTLVVWQAAGAFLFGLSTAPFQWVMPTLFDFGFLALLGLVANVAHMCVTRSLKLAPASVVTPYQYSFIAWATLWGWLFFGDVPDHQMLIGAAVIVATGLVLLWTEAAAGRRT